MNEFTVNGLTHCWEAEYQTDQIFSKKKKKKKKKKKQKKKGV